ncbi:MAG: SEC-C metal-binding domain-containing protein [Candidatus Woesearchaeota archaeon]
MSETINQTTNGIIWELENICPCGSGKLFKDCCNKLY